MFGTCGVRGAGAVSEGSDIGILEMGDHVVILGVIAQTFCL